MDWVAEFFDKGVPLGILIMVTVGVLRMSDHFKGLREDNKDIKGSLNDIKIQAAEREVKAEERLNRLFQFLTTLFTTDKRRQSGGR